MCHFEAAFCLALELVKRGTVLNHQIGKKFQRDIPLQFFVAREPDNPHATASEDLDQGVATEDFLSADKLARSRRQDIACAFVTHVGQVYNISVERKVKRRCGLPTSTSVRAQLSADSKIFCPLCQI